MSKFSFSFQSCSTDMPFFSRTWCNGTVCNGFLFCNVDIKDLCAKAVQMNLQHHKHELKYHLSSALWSCDKYLVAKYEHC